MCILCGELIMTVHWTDQPLHDQEYKNQTKIVAGSMQHSRMKQRLKRASLAGKILGYYGLTIKEWMGSRFMLFDKKGTSNVVYDLGDMWKVAEDMSHKKLDPLDPEFLAYLKEGV